MLQALRNTLITAFLVLVCCSSSVLRAQAVSATATLNVSGAEQFPNGTPDNGSLTVAFNGYTETIQYSQYSSPASLASGLAAMFCRDYNRYGLFAKSGANNNTDLTAITFQLTHGQTFGSINYTLSSSSFGFSSSGFTAVNPAPVPLAITGTSLPKGPPQMGFVITGTGFGPSDSTPDTYVVLNGVELTTLSWSYNSITVQLPSGTPLGAGNLVVTVNGVSSSVTPLSSFTVDPPFACPASPTD